MIKVKEKNIYSWSAKYYDLLMNKQAIECDINFYKSFINTNSSVLDIGCGTGREALRLFEFCKKIVCLDISESMLSIFKSRLKSVKSNNITIIKADMLNFKLNEEFDLVILPFRVFQALTCNGQRTKFLRNVKKHMSKNSVLIIQMFEPNNQYLANYKNMNRLDIEYQDVENEILLRRYSIGVSHQQKRQVVKSKYKFQIIKNSIIIEDIEEPLELGYLYKIQADKLFAESGFVTKALYNDFGFNEYNPDVIKELIYVLQKK